MSSPILKVHVHFIKVRPHCLTENLPRDGWMKIEDKVLYLFLITQLYVKQVQVRLRALIYTGKEDNPNFQ